MQSMVSKMMYGVFDNDKPASSVGFPHLKGKGWENHIFGTMKEAEAYAKEWLGDYYSRTIIFYPNVPYEYSSHGDMIEIRTIPVHTTHNENCPCWKKQ